jgi:formylglycine-generating enzyme required for sulfatase activity
MGGTDANGGDAGTGAIGEGGSTDAGGSGAGQSGASGNSMGGSGMGGMNLGGSGGAGRSGDGGTSIGGSGATAGGAGVGGSIGGGHGCPTDRLEGPPLVQVPAPQGGAYCVDATEVTNGQYARFLAAPPQDLAPQPPECSWNDNYTPSNDWSGSGVANYPVTYVDWCDAYAYCRWAGKHLCGKIGGGTNSFVDHGDATKSEWYNACSKGGSQAYAYGNDYSAMVCNGGDNGAGQSIAVGSKLACEGGYPGLYDLSGNVEEWEDSCNAATGSSDRCRTRGGNFDLFGSQGHQCDINDDDLRNSAQRANVGFRCCAASL